MNRIRQLALLLGVLAPLPLTPAAATPAAYSEAQGAYEAYGEPVGGIIEIAQYSGIAQYYDQYGNTTPAVQSERRGRVIPPSVALQTALSYSPGSMGLGVRLLPGRRLMYSVKLKTGNQIHRVLVDAQTGQVVGQ